MELNLAVTWSAATAPQSLPTPFSLSNHQQNLPASKDAVLCFAPGITKQMNLWRIFKRSYRVLPQSFTIQLIVVVCTELLEADPSIVVRVDPIHQLLCPLLVVLREGCVDFFHREKSIVVCVRLLFKELLPRGLLRTPQPFLVPCALGTDVVVAEEAIEPVVAVVGLGKDLVAGGARLAVPGPLPASEANHILIFRRIEFFSYISGQSLSFSPHWQKTL